MLRLHRQAGWALAQTGLGALLVVGCVLPPPPSYPVLPPVPLRAAGGPQGQGPWVWHFDSGLKHRLPEGWRRAFRPAEGDQWAHPSGRSLTWSRWPGVSDSPDSAARSQAQSWGLGIVKRRRLAGALPAFLAEGAHPSEAFVVMALPQATRLASGRSSNMVVVRGEAPDLESLVANTQVDHSPLALLQGGLDALEADALGRAQVDWPSRRAQWVAELAAEPSASAAVGLLQDALRVLGDRHGWALPPLPPGPTPSLGFYWRPDPTASGQEEVIWVDAGSEAEKAQLAVGDRFRIVGPIDSSQPLRIEALGPPGRPEGALQVPWRISNRPTPFRLRSAELGQGVAYLEVGAFADLSQWDAYIAQLRGLSQGLRDRCPQGLVLDLRRNSGGLTQAMALGLQPWFPPTDRLVAFERPGEAPLWAATSQGQLLWDLPLAPESVHSSTGPRVVVLTSQITGSAGEWLAMAFRKPGKNLILGERSAGLATSLRHLEAWSGEALSYSDAWMVDRLGEKHPEGVPVDEVIPIEPSRWGAPEEAAIRRAKAWLLQSGR